MLRLVHAARTDGENFKMNPRIEAYFKDRLGLANPQIEYLMGLAKRSLIYHINPLDYV